MIVWESTTSKDYWGSGKVSIVFDPSPYVVPWRWTVVDWSWWFLWPFWRCELSLFSLIYIHSRTLCYDTALVLNRHLHSLHVMKIQRVWWYGWGPEQGPRAPGSQSCKKVSRPGAIGWQELCHHSPCSSSCPFLPLPTTRAGVNF